MYRVNQYFYILLPASPKLHFYFDLKTLFALSQEQCLEMLRMVQQLTSCHGLSYNTVPNKQVVLHPRQQDCLHLYQESWDST